MCIRDRSRSEVKSVENIDDRIRGGRADSFGLSKIADKKGSAAGFGQCLCDGADAAAVGVSLDYCRTFSVGALCKSFPIKRNGSQIDF